MELVFSFASFKIPFLLTIKIFVMLTCVPFKTFFLLEKDCFSRIIANKFINECSWFITRSLLRTNTVSSDGVKST